MRDAAPRLIVLRLVGGADEGKWLSVCEPRPHAHEFNGRTIRKVELVTTGCVEWRDDVPAEVYVPADKLALWKAEHQC